MAVDYPTGDRAGVSIVNVAVREELDNGRAKRKGRKPAIKEESSDDSDTPLVSLSLLASAHEPFDGVTSLCTPCIIQRNVTDFPRLDKTP